MHTDQFVSCLSCFILAASLPVSLPPLPSVSSALPPSARREVYEEINVSADSSLFISAKGKCEEL